MMIVQQYHRFALLRTVYPALLLYSFNRVAFSDINLPHSFNDADENLNRFSTKTSYRSSFPTSLWWILERGNLSEQPMQCELVHIDGLVRHGIRCPGAKDVRRAPELMRKLEPYLPNDVVETFKLVHDRLLAVKPKSLMPEGFREQADLARRLTRNYPFLNDTKPNDFVFMASTSQRTQDSFEGFYKGLFGSDCTDLAKHLEVSDVKLRFFDTCTKFIREVENSDEAMKEYHLFKGTVSKSVAPSLQQRLQTPDVDISYGELKALYIYAGLENSLFETSHLASIFTVEELLALEYASDLKNYWKKAYGHEINYLQACPLLQDFFSHMDAIVAGDRSHKAVLRFGHAETFLPLIALLGLFNDPIPLRADNYESQMHRKFKTSNLCPFSTNLFFLIYKKKSETPSGAESVKPSKYYVKLMVNEQPIKFPFSSEMSEHLGDEYLYPYSVVRKHYSKIVDGCNVNTLCENSYDEL